MTDLQPAVRTGKVPERGIASFEGNRLSVIGVIVE